MIKPPLGWHFNLCAFGPRFAGKNTSCLEKITLDAKVPDVVERQSCAHRKCLIGTKTLGLGTCHVVENARFVAIYALFGHNFRFFVVDFCCFVCCIFDRTLVRC